MMTTDMRTSTAAERRSVLGPAALATVAVGLLLSVVAALVTGSEGAYGALAGTALATVVFAFGGVVVDAVSRSWPAMSLLVALLTYTLQVVLMAAAFAALDGSGLLGPTLDRQWLGGAVITGVLVWLGVQVPLSLSRRIPVYDLARQADE